LLIQGKKKEPEGRAKAKNASTFGTETQAGAGMGKKGSKRKSRLPWIQVLNCSLGPIERGRLKEYGREGIKDHGIRKTLWERGQGILLGGLLALVMFFLCGHKIGAKFPEATEHV